MSRRVSEANLGLPNPRVPFGLESHFRPVRHEWLYYIAPKIIDTLKPYHDNNVGTQPVISHFISRTFYKTTCFQDLNEAKK